MNVQPLPIARISNLMSSTLTAGQLDSTQQQLLLIETQLSTGKQFGQPSQDVTAATMTMELQRTLTQSNTYLGTISNSQSALGTVDNSLNNLTTLLQQAQGIASADVNSSVTNAQRQADAQIIDSILSQSVSEGNKQYNNLYIYGGDKNTEPPFVTSNGGVRFDGTNNVLTNAVDSGTNLAFQVSSADVFGPSAQVTGSTDLSPSATPQTLVSDIRGAGGVAYQPGSIQISNGATTKIVDLSQASTLGDVVNDINAAGVGGITASITGQGLTLTGLPTDNITVTGVAGSQTAAALGISTASGGAGAGVPVIGTSVGPSLAAYTPLATLRNGAGLDASGITLRTGTTTTAISFAGLQTVGDVLNAINSKKLGVTAQIDPSGSGIDIVNNTQGLALRVSENGGTSAAELGIQSFSPQTRLSSLNGGAGVGLASSGPDFQITRSDGTTFSVSLAGANTVADAINDINTAAGGAGVAASFSTTANAIVLTDTAGGAGTLKIAPLNSSSAASDLGLTQNLASGNVITGNDVNPVTSTGLFSHLADLRNALLAGNQQAITKAAEGLQGDYSAVTLARGKAGAAVQELQSRQTQIQNQNLTTQSLMSQLSDTDFTAAITKFQTLQTSLQATLQTAAKTLNESLLNFLG